MNVGRARGESERLCRVACREGGNGQSDAPNQKEMQIHPRWFTILSRAVAFVAFKYSLRPHKGARLCHLISALAVVGGCCFPARCCSLLTTIHNKPQWALALLDLPQWTQGLAREHAPACPCSAGAGLLAGLAVPATAAALAAAAGLSRRGLLLAARDRLLAVLL